jgi:hypothetical protein
VSNFVVLEVDPIIGVCQPDYVPMKGLEGHDASNICLTRDYQSFSRAKMTRETVEACDASTKITVINVPARLQ